MTALISVAAVVVSIMLVKAYAASDKVKNLKGEIYNAVSIRMAKIILQESQSLKTMLTIILMETATKS